METKLDLGLASAADLDAIAEFKGHGFEIVRDREERDRFTQVRELEEARGLACRWDGAERSLKIGGADAQSTAGGDAPPPSTGRRLLSRQMALSRPMRLASTMPGVAPEEFERRQVKLSRRSTNSNARFVPTTWTF